MVGVARIFDESELSDIIKLYNDGNSLLFIATKYNVDNHKISKILKSKNISIRNASSYQFPATAKPLLDKLWLEAQLKTKTAYEIADELSVSTNCVYTYIEKHKIILVVKNADITKDKLIKLYVDEKKNTRTIAKIFNTGKSTILDYMKLYGIKSRTSNELNNKYAKYPFLTKELLAQLYVNEKLSTHAIGKKYNIPQIVISRLLCDYDIPRKTINDYVILSAGEQKLADYVKSVYGGIVVRNKQLVFNNKKHEADIFLPDINVAIEYNGLRWHSDEFKKPSYHKDKFKFFADNNIRLIQIWEDWWLNNTDIVKSIVSNVIKIDNKKLYARKLILKKISSSEIVNFLEHNHIQGCGNSSIAYGLFDGSELIQIISFRKYKEYYEIDRIATKLYISVIGGLQKLFKAFLNEYKPSKIITYSSNDLFTGKAYERLGFKFVGYTEPRYYYFKKQSRYDRRNFQKHKLVAKGFDINKTETKIMKENGYKKFYDSGNSKFEYIL